jgi:tryptophan-rich sensory protein
MNPTTKTWLGLAGFVAACFLAAGIGSWLTVPNVGDWYRQLSKPSWTPPDWVFGPVWTVLYLMMAVAAWLVWQKHGWSGAPIALGLFAGQLLLNVAWSGVFFGLRQPGAAFAELVVLWLAILATIIAFWQKQTAAGLIMLPYGLWVTFAGALNFAIWQLNR